ncbi:adenosylcobinamide-GDP ribazoletransferase [Microlunatus flavus]|uniref:Adenosylcobinamide-GDP ribazoletransferase n=1 Tax=Microlunatus flavus TaxID=1036181 RepID=A0A1H9NSR1_9ACTN|nr:adenosylcobinamide-GDP ribazoletransferase [Microlunatus flavus]SER38807.1 adenosylcobinamide-GDP ribazoletransferase [Microlunatus flavus]
MSVDALRLAGGFLSVLPVRPVSDPDRRTAGRAMVLAPLAVLPLGAVTAAVVVLAQVAGLPAALRAVLVVGTLALGTRAMHLDGLADTVDGLGASWDRARALEVMRRGDVGPMGAVALLVVLGLQVAGLAALPYAAGGALAVLLLVCASRAALVLVCRRGVPAARPDGLGRVVAGSVGPVGAGTGVVLLLGLPALAAVATGRPWWQGMVAGALAVVVVVALVGHTVRRLGGVSGDVMGAAVEAALATLLVVLAARP